MGRSEPHPSWATAHPFSSDASHPDLAVTPRLGAQSPKPASTQTPAANGAPRSLPSAPPTADLRISTPISQVHWFTGMCRQNSGKHLTCVYWVIKEATQEATGREAWGGVWMAGGGALPFPLRDTTLRAPPVFNDWEPPEPHLSGLFMEASFHGHVLLDHVPLGTDSLDREIALGPKVPTVQSRLVLSGDQAPSWTSGAPPRSTSLAQTQVWMKGTYYK